MGCSCLHLVLPSFLLSGEETLESVMNETVAHPPEKVKGGHRSWGLLVEWTGGCPQRRSEAPTGLQGRQLCTETVLLGSGCGPQSRQDCLGQGVTVGAGV